MIEESIAENGAEEAHHLVVDGGLFDRAILDRGQQSLGVHEARIGHFQVEAVVGSADGVVGGVPVGHENALETPLALEHLEVEKLVLGGMNAVDEVVGVHDGVDVALGDGGLEGRQVDLAHGALVGVGADVVAVVLLIIQGKVLDGGDDALGLDALDEWNHQDGVQIGVFREVLEVAAGHGRAGNVDAGTEQEIDAACAGILAEALADLARQGRVPCGGQRHAAGIGGGGSPGAHADGGVGHLEAWQVDGGGGMGVHVIDAADELDLLLESKFGQPGVGFGLDGRRGGHGRLCQGLDGCGQGATEQDGEKTCEAQGRNRLNRGFF